MKGLLGCRAVIVSRDNRRLKDMRRLKRCKEPGRVMLEGPHLVGEAAAAGIELDYVLATPEFLSSAPAVELLAALSEPPLSIDATLLDELADADSPRGLVAAARLPERRLEDLPRRLAGPLVLAEAIQDPGNLGALARAAEAAGAGALCLTPGTVHPGHPRALRASAGSLLRLSVASGVAPGAVARHYAAQAPPLVALTPRQGADLYRLELGATPILMIGSEGRGLSDAALAAADLRLTIPLAGRVESLNTAVAAAVVLFELARRRAG